MPERLIQLREVLSGAQQRAQEAIDAVLALPDDAAQDVVDAAVVEQDEAIAESERAKGAVAKREALLRSREAHTPEPIEGDGVPSVPAGGTALHARARGEQRTEPTYRADTGGFFLDLALGKQGDSTAIERLHRNNREWQDRTGRPIGMQERAGINTTATSGGEFVPPDWTNELWAPFLRVGRPFADQCLNLGSPSTTSWNLPRVTTGASVAVQTEGSAASNTDEVTDSIAAVLLTPAGRSIASYQVVDLSEPGIDQIIYMDLVGALNAEVDRLLLNSTTTSAKGVLQLSGTNAVTVTITTPTGPLLWAYFFQGQSAIQKGAFTEVDFMAMHPSTWNWFLATLDVNNRPLALSTTGAAFNTMAEFTKAPQGLAGNIAGIPVILDANIPVNLGAGTNQAQIVMCNRSGLLKKESAPVFKIADQTSVTSLQYNFVLYAYLQMMFGRHPKKFSVLGGTGLVVQSGY